MEGLVAAGADAVDIGMGPTPLAYFAAHHLGCGSCVAVSGSHNPPDYNGLKMVVGGDALYGDDIQDLRKRVEQRKFSTGSGKRTKADVLDAYAGYATPAAGWPWPCDQQEKGGRDMW